MRLNYVMDVQEIEGGLKVTMAYIGKSLSVNHFKYFGKYTKPDTKLWMQNLAFIIRSYCKNWQPPVTIKLSGGFLNERSRPDLHNLHKVIGDAVQDGLGINDKHFSFVDGEVKVGIDYPYMEIEIGGGDG